MILSIYIIETHYIRTTIKNNPIFKSLSIGNKTIYLNIIIINIINII
jgi:hypothetical protein